MKAVLIHQFKQAYGEGRIEGVIWRVPEPVPPTRHGYKYRLVYVKNGISWLATTTNGVKATTGM